MKVVSIFILISFFYLNLFLTSCCKNDETERCDFSGEILYYDYTECLCCPGWVIKTGNDTIKTEVLPNPALVMKEIENYGFPVAIEFDYKDTIGICSQAYKKVTCLTVKEHL